MEEWHLVRIYATQKNTLICSEQDGACMLHRITERFLLSC